MRIMQAAAIHVNHFIIMIVSCITSIYVENGKFARLALDPGVREIALSQEIFGRFHDIGG